MYATMFKENPFDPVRGKLYRDKVLLPGSSCDEKDIIEVSSFIFKYVDRQGLICTKDFLGRPPNSDAFLKQIFGPTSD